MISIKNVRLHTVELRQIYILRHAQYWLAIDKGDYAVVADQHGLQVPR